MTGRLFFGGVPTDRDVKALIALGVEPGMDLAYELVEKTIGVLRTEHRFGSVVTAWRRRVFREHRLRIRRQGGVFRFLTSEECLTQSTIDMHRVGKAIGRTTVYIDAVRTDDLDDEGLRRHALLRQNAHVVLNATREACKEIALPKPIGTTVSTLRLAKV